jgi:hypothetical protein
VRRLGLAVAVAVAACGGAGPALRVPPLAPPHAVAPPLPRLGAVTLAPLVDRRPTALRVSRGPQQDQRFDLLMIGTGAAWLHGRRVEGQTLVAGDRLRFTGPAADGPAVVAGFVAALLEQGAGHAVVRAATPVSLAAPDRIAAALGVRDGVVVVPILDQLDVTALSSDNSMHGGSSYETAHTRTTATYRVTSGAAELTSTTDAFANARVRLLVLQIQGGAAVGRHVIYGRGAGPALGAAFDDLGDDLARGLVALFGAPLEAPPPDVPPDAITPDAPARRDPARRLAARRDPARGTDHPRRAHAHAHRHHPGATMTSSSLSLALLLALGACAGASRVTFIDSSTTPSRTAIDQKIVGNRVDASACGARGVARIEAYFSVPDRMIKLFTMSMSQPRHARVVCAEGPR